MAVRLGAKACLVFVLPFCEDWGRAPPLPDCLPVLTSGAFFLLLTGMPCTVSLEDSALVPD